MSSHLWQSLGQPSGYCHLPQSLLGRSARSQYLGKGDKGQSQGRPKTEQATPHPTQSKFKPLMGTLGLRESHSSGVGRTLSQQAAMSPSLLPGWTMSLLAPSTHPASLCTPHCPLGSEGGTVPCDGTLVLSSAGVGHCCQLAGFKPQAFAVLTSSKSQVSLG